VNVVRQQWNEKAEEWGNFAQDDASYWTRRLQMIADLSMKHVPRGRSLDVGCGPGLLVRLLTKAGFEAHGADIAENMVQKAAALLEGLVPDPGARVHHCPDGGVPFDAGREQFDLITAIGILEYITDRQAYVHKYSETRGMPRPCQHKRDPVALRDHGGLQPRLAALAQGQRGDDAQPCGDGHLERWTYRPHPCGLALQCRCARRPCRQAGT